jgi:putative transposase
LGLRERGVLICDRNRKWPASLCERLGKVGVHVGRTPYQAPNANAYAEPFVRSIKEECFDQMILLGEQHLRRSAAEFVAYYLRERNHQRLGNRLIEGTPGTAEFAVAPGLAAYSLITNELPEAIHRLG